MTSGQKIAFSMLLSMLIFAGFVICANLKLFPELETRFYAQTKIAEKTQQLDSISKGVDSYISNILTKTKDYSDNPAVATFIEQNPSEQQVSQRRILTEKLFSDIPQLNGIRILDKNGRNVHYSSYDSTDILKQNGITKVYKNYQDIQKDSNEIDFSHFKYDENSAERFEPKILVDSEKSRLIICVPLYWLENIYSGNLICYFSFYDIRQLLVANGIFAYGENFGIFANNSLKGGITIGIPLGSFADFKAPVLENWSKQKTNENQLPEKILSSHDERYWTLLTASASEYLKVSGVYLSSYFELSQDVIWMIYVCVFITIFLIIYLIFSLQKDSVLDIKRKIRKLQSGIIQEYINQRESIDWEKVSNQLNSQKNTLLDDLKKDLIKHSKKNREKISQLVEKGWSDIISVIKDPENKKEVKAELPVTQTTVSQTPGFSMAELRNMIEDVLKTARINVNASNVVPVAVKTNIAEPEVEEIEDVAELDEVSELDEVEEVSELDEVEEIEDVAEIDEVSELDEVEEIDEVAEIDEVTELDEVEDVEEVEDVAELDEVEPVEDHEDVAELDEVEEIEDVAELDEVEEVEDIEEVAELDEVEEVSELDEVEEIEDVAELDEVEEVDDIEETPAPSPILGDLEEYIEEGEEKEPVIEDERYTFYTVDSLFPEHDEYIESHESFIRSEIFPSVENLFAEELSLGGEYTAKGKKSQNLVDFEVHNIAELLPPKMIDELEEIDDKIEVEEKIDELSEEVEAPEIQGYFSMTQFAQKYEIIESLEDAEINKEKVITENDGVFQISDNLDYSNAEIKQNLDFKNLVDKVLHQK